MNGALVLDKPKGFTSNVVLKKIKKYLGVKKAGYTGILDPFATGVLPICINESTKIIPYLDEYLKEYSGVIHLGIKTDTLDSTGTILEENKVGKIKESDILECFRSFEGKIKQLPPMYSAIKKNGVRLYSLARKGLVVDRERRDIFIENLNLDYYNPPHIGFTVLCSKGTYIRSLCADIADKLGCGGHLKDLNRLSSGMFKISDSYKMEEVEKGNYSLIGINSLLNNLKNIDMDSELSEKVKKGKKLKMEYFGSLTLPSFKEGERLAIKENGVTFAVAEALIDSDKISQTEVDDVMIKALRVLNIN